MIFVRLKGDNDVYAKSSSLVSPMCKMGPRKINLAFDISHVSGRSKIEITKSLGPVPCPFRCTSFSSSADWGEWTVSHMSLPSVWLCLPAFLLLKQSHPQKLERIVQ